MFFHLHMHVFLKNNLILFWDEVTAVIHAVRSAQVTLTFRDYILLYLILMCKPSAIVSRLGQSTMTPFVGCSLP